MMVSMHMQRMVISVGASAVVLAVVPFLHNQQLAEWFS